MTYLRAITLATLMALLASCGTIYSYSSGGSDTSPAASGAGDLRQALSGLFNRTPPPTPEQVLTPQALAQIKDPFLLITLETNGGFEPAVRWAGFARAGFNGDAVTWVEGSARTMSFTKAGVLLATRGYGRDVMTVRADELQRVLSGRQTGAAKALRVQRLLDGENQIVTLSMLCRISQAGSQSITLLTGRFATRRVDEACLLPDGTEVINRYWLDGSGVIRQSEQWVSPEVGRIRVQRLR